MPMVRLADLGISIHVPREGDDLGSVGNFADGIYFNPRPP